MTKGDNSTARNAAARLFAATGASVQQQLAAIEVDAKALLADGSKSAETRRWVVLQMEVCAQVFCEPPPPALVKLAAVLMEVTKPPKARRNPEKYSEFIKFIQRHPDATVSTIRREIRYDQSAQIKKWLAEPNVEDLRISARIRRAQKK
jgi:hypothetical protein